MSSDVLNRVNEYLELGGLLNPELANHASVRDLIIDLRDEISNLRDETGNLRGLIGLPPEGFHSDEWFPRDKTWHAERQNWIAEVNMLRSLVEQNRSLR